MATKPRNRRPRAIQPYYPTGAHEIAATKGQRYIADLDGVAPNKSGPFVIRDQETGEVIERCPNVTKSEIDERVALLNRGTPTRTDNVSWGRLSRRSRTVTRADKWFERLCYDQQTKAVLKQHQDSNTVLYRVDLEALMRLVTTNDLRLSTDDEVCCKELDAVSFQLFAKLGIRRSGSEYQ